MSNIRQKAARRGAFEQAARSAVAQSRVRMPLVHYRTRAIEPADVMLASYPKSGNTWLRHMLTHLVVGESTDWRAAVHAATPGLQFARDAKPTLQSGGRMIKTHEFPHQRYRQSIVIVRDGRDVAVSEYFYRKDYLESSAMVDETFSTFLDRFIDGKTNSYGAWHDHVSAWRSFADAGNSVLWVRYEDIKSQPLQELRRIADYIDLDSTDEQLNDAIAHNDASRLRKREAAANGADAPSFIRSAKSGDWASTFSDAELQRFVSVAGPELRAFNYVTDADKAAG